MLPKEAYIKTVETFNINIDELASKCGIDKSDLSKFKNGRQDFGSAKLHRVISALRPIERSFFYSLLQSDCYSDPKMLPVVK